MNNKTINICITTTCDRHLKFAASFLESLYEHLNPGYIYHLYFLSNEIVNENIKNKLFYKKIENFEVTFIHIDEKKVFGKYENLKNRSNIILYRWLLSDYINEDRILFMDNDTIIRGDISELYFTDLGDNIIGAAKDCVLWDTPILKEYNITKYFNAGVQLIDLKKWRELRIKEKALEFINNNFHKLGIPDQDTLNIILKGKWLCLSPKWNGINMNTFTSKGTQYTAKEFYELRHPVIVHYAGGQHRPWGGLICVHPKWYLYYKYIFKTRYWDMSDVYKFPLRVLTSNYFCRFLYKICRFLYKIAVLLFHGQC